MDRIRLTRFERRVAKAVAETRAKTDQKWGAADMIQSRNEGSLQIAIRGFSGELAFCRLFNAYPDLETDRISDYDAMIAHPSGGMALLVDIKTSRSKDGLYVYRRKADHPADLYALMIEIRNDEISEYEFAGFIKAADLFREENLVDRGSGPCYFVPRSALRSLFMLKMEGKL